MDFEASVPAQSSPAAEMPCFHCVTRCRGTTHRSSDKAFCCQDCLTVFELRSKNGRPDFYSLSNSAEVCVKATAKTYQFKFLSDAAKNCIIVALPAAQAVAASDRIHFYRPSDARLDHEVSPAI